MIDKDDHKSEFPAKNVYLESVPMTALKKSALNFLSFSSGNWIIGEFFIIFMVFNKSV